jgi:hypothetical protein
LLEIISAGLTMGGLAKNTDIYATALTKSHPHKSGLSNPHPFLHMHRLCTQLQERRGKTGFFWLLFAIQLRTTCTAFAAQTVHITSKNLTNLVFIAALNPYLHSVMNVTCFIFVQKNKQTSY